MDVIISLAISEIALEGNLGCSFTRFWNLLDQRIQKEKKERCKSEFYLRELVDCEFPDLRDSVKEQIWDLIKASANFVIYIAPESYVSAEAAFETRSEPCLVPRVVDAGTEQFAALTFAEASKCYGAFLFVRLTETLRVFKLLPASIRQAESQKSVGLYALIARSRSNGVLAVALSKASGIEPKSLPHFTAPFIKAGLVVRVNGIVCPGHVSYLLIARDFANGNSAYNQQEQLLARSDSAADTVRPLSEILPASENGSQLVLKTQILVLITQMLDAAESKTMFAEDILAALDMKHSKARHRFNKCLQSLENNGYVSVYLTPVAKTNSVLESTGYPTPSPTPHSSPARRKSSKSSSLVRAVKLLKLYTTHAEATTPDAVSSKETTAQFTHLMSLEYQVWQCIALSGDLGVTAFEIISTLKVTEKLVTSCLERFSKAKSSGKCLDAVRLIIKKQAETAGRERRFRYFCSPMPANFTVALTSATTLATSSAALSDEKRREIVLGAIASKTLVPADLRLVQLANEFLAKHCSPLSFRFDRRTVINIAKELASTGKVHFLDKLSFPGLSGGPQFVVCGPFRPYSASELSFFEKALTEYVSPPPQSAEKFVKKRKVMTPSGHIERLSEFAARNAAQFQMPETENPVLNPRASVAAAVTRNIASESVSVAQKYYFEPALMSRCRLFHRALQRVYAKEPNCTVSIAQLPLRLTVWEFLTCIGVFKISSALDRYVQALTAKEISDETVAASSVCDSLVFVRGSGRKYLQQNLAVLAALNVLKPMTAQGRLLDYDAAAAEYGDVALFARFKYERIPVLPAPLSLADYSVDTLWEYLRSCPASVAIQLPAPLQQVGSARSWSSKSTMLTPHETELIDSYVDVKSLYTPLHNPFLISKIALQLNIPAYRIRARYRYIERRFRLQASSAADENLVSLRAKVRNALETVSERVPDSRDRRRFIVWTPFEDAVLVHAAIVCEFSETELRRAFSRNSAAAGIPWSKFASVLLQLSERSAAEFGLSFPSEPAHAVFKSLPASRVSFKQALATLPMIGILRRWWSRLVKSGKLLRQFKHFVREYDANLGRSNEGSMAVAIEKAEREATGHLVPHASVVELEKARSEARYAAEISELVRRSIEFLRKSQISGMALPELSDDESFFAADDAESAADESYADESGVIEQTATTVTLPASFDECLAAFTALESTSECMTDVDACAGTENVSESHKGSAVVSFEYPSAASELFQAPRVCAAVGILKAMLRTQADSERNDKVLDSFSAECVKSAVAWLKRAGCIAKRRVALHGPSSTPGSKYILSEKFLKACKSTLPARFYLKSGSQSDSRLVGCALEQFARGLVNGVKFEVEKPSDLLSGKFSYVEFGYWIISNVKVTLSVDATTATDSARTADDEISEQLLRVLCNQRIGLTFDELAEQLNLSGRSDMAKLDGCLAALVTGNKVECVNFNSLYILPEFADDYKCSSAVPRAWKSLDGTVDATLWDGYASYVLETVSNNPGIPLNLVQRMSADGLTGSEISTLVYSLQQQQSLCAEWHYDSIDQKCKKYLFINTLFF